MEAIASAPKHIVLVHGACHGGWSWYKVATRLRSAGYRVTAPDLAASGVDSRRLHEVPTLRDYTRPLLDVLQSLPSGENLIVVGHSSGGLSLALAAELFPQKIAAAVFLSAFMPDCTHRPSYVLEHFMESNCSEYWLDTALKPQDAEGKLPNSMLFGRRFLEERLYQLCSPEDLTLGKTLMRVSSLFVEDLKLQEPFSKSRYGSVPTVYVSCKQDQGIVQEFQRWMLMNIPVQEVKEIAVADHMAMLSAPDEVVKCLTDIAERYA